MPATRRLNYLAALMAAGLGSGACTGPKGDPGTPGTNGTNGTNGASGTNGADGKNGTNGVDAPATGTVAGVVTDAVANDPLAAVKVAIKDSGGAPIASATTDATGKFTATAPIGTVVLSLSKDNYTSPGDVMVGVIGGQTVTVNASLSESSSARPSLAIAVTGNDFGYGKVVNLTVNGTSPTSATLTYQWSNATGGGLGTVAGNGASATVTMPTLTQAMASRLEDGKTPTQYISGYVFESRFGILPVMTDTRGELSVQVKASDGRGQSATASVTLDAASIQSGVRDVAIGSRVYLNSGHDTGNTWSLTAPSGSTAALDDPTARFPSFVADIRGKYTVSESGGTATNTMDIYSGDWVGGIAGGTGDTVTADSDCTLCHSQGSVAEDKFTPWLGTRHASMFTQGINGEKSSHYSGACATCHTVGYDTGVANNGFDDVALKDNWSFPAVLAATNWGDLSAHYPDLARLANIQCESCHGPNNSDAHHANNTATGYAAEYTSPRINYSAEVCGTCHTEGTTHHRYSEWTTTDATTGWGHSNRGTTAFAVGASALNNHCGRCHSAQGYEQYSAQLSSGTPGLLAVTTGVSAANVEPITCVACHDPHDATNPNQLRLYGDTPLLPAGFSMWGVGKGALCISCHNSRNGLISGTNNTYLHEDSETYNSGNPTGYSAPHQACQGDVFAGHNAYFLGSLTPMTSKHAAIEDACVGCHMTLQPSTHLAFGTPTASSHEFRITDADKATLCANCHGAGVDGEGIQGSVEAQLKALGVKMGQAVQSKITTAGKATLVVYDSASGLYSIAPGAAKNPANLSPFVLDVTQAAITSVTIEEIHGQVGFVINLATPVSVQLVDSSGNPSGGPVSKSALEVQMGSIKDTSTPPVAMFALSGNLVRAGWNYFLIEGDQSKGLHNPTFAMTVLDNTLSKDLSY
jgi:hypothetical protein